MSLESFFNHPLLIWEWLTFIIIMGVLRVSIKYAWKRGKKDGRQEYDEYKKWEKRFKDEKRIKDD